MLHRRLITPAFVSTLAVLSLGARCSSDGTTPVTAGRYVAFSSDAANFATVTAGTNVFLRDRETGATSLISVASDGTPGNGASDDAEIGDDGRYVVFESVATNLVAGDTNTKQDIFLRDRQSGTTERVSLADDESQADADCDLGGMSIDGRYIVLYSAAVNLITGDSNGASDVFLRDRQSGTTERVSLTDGELEGNGASTYCAVSSDGRWVAFTSSASNLVAGDSNGSADVFVRDRQSGTTTRVSVASDGTQGNGISGDLPNDRVAISATGRYIAFDSAATNLVAGDTNGSSDVFIRDRETGTTTRVSVASDGTQGNNTSAMGSLSSDGRFVCFFSYAFNLVASDTNGVQDVFVHDRQTGATTRVSIATDGTAGNGHSTYGRISRDGRFVVFDSVATNLVSGDTNGVQDVFVRDRDAGTTSRISVSGSGVQGNGVSELGVISGP